jgi:hypothetical protein
MAGKGVHTGNYWNRTELHELRNYRNYMVHY